ncbi:biopolymer transporter TolR [Stenotrophomonas chelatiphaga]|jgi:biopolymer transport protein TolR|uniref:Tol-Pal system protein TolR n=1 Tax=Stenotrophomonas chelatiphaga TaxID=517011 RepID=A0A0R0CJ33_9GAMM|nr:MULTISPECIES: protein TolR [Stenotrophomonas]KRG69520.1 biopolymer transporter TolR [Stenotrophomonas chelatiphaga]MCS4232751.1 biopolymer transport protein TolR [Stenotrophomonas chelatiphaga]MDR6095403.1 biopolymer transport protein TolR [Stenotrophomonas sp. SORGH_AS_0321]ROQ43918.1 cell division and transport-associated protein TolR [Stenotrophomonas maltophilia]
MSAIGRRKRRKLKSEINVVPYIDVMLVLLIIFMVTAPLLTLSFEVDLPRSNAKALESKQDPIIVSVRADGQLSLKLPDDKQPNAMSSEEMQARLGGIVAQDKAVRVIVAADRAVAYEKVVAAMDVLKRANVEKVGLATDAQ